MRVKSNFVFADVVCQSLNILPTTTVQFLITCCWARLWPKLNTYIVHSSLKVWLVIIVFHWSLWFRTYWNVYLWNSSNLLIARDGNIKLFWNRFCAICNINQRAHPTQAHFKIYKAMFQNRLKDQCISRNKLVTDGGAY